MRISRLILLSVVFIALSGCFWASKEDSTQVTGYPQVATEDDLYLLYPQTLSLHEQLDEANAYYYLGDIESSIIRSDLLLDNIHKMKAEYTEPYLCSHLDSLELLVSFLKEKIIEEDDIREWQSHISSALDSIGLNHVVEEEIEIVYNWRTDYWIKYFTGKGRRNFKRWLERAEIYRDIIEPVLVKNEIPRDLLYLAVIESGLNLNAKSNVKATGPWQFMAGTGRIFNLRINWWIDERKDIVASTYAASHYLKHLHNLFGDWQLALASYNSGEYRVAHAISTQKTRDYWRLRLPSQTRWFVPKFMAALAIGRDPEKYGFTTPEPNPLRFDIVTLDRSTDLKIIASAAGCTLAKIQKLNPALKRWATPPGMVVEIKVPYGTGEKVVSKINSIPPGERVSWLRHKIGKGETLSYIASKYEISQKELKRINGIKNVHKIRTGQLLLIPTRDDGTQSAGSSSPKYMTTPNLPGKIKMKNYSAPEGKTKLVYTVRDRDTLGEIAEKFNVGLSKIRSWNNLRYKSLIHPGDNLVIYVDDGLEFDDYSGDRTDKKGKKELIHIVKKGETLSSICKRYRMRISDILAWNDKMNKDRLYPGDRIRLWVEDN
ncbi:MAG: LysM peptidoglycan-binding domain-containing protein [Candidatus Krumholzibacteriota bacterium]|nr:LysM peptidoglycan-binding domain-containing protein [Candidatus Krumholzibacteriota bacterium]